MSDIVHTDKQVVHLHTHSEYSAFDGCGRQETFIERAKEMGQPAIGFSEHGSMRGCYKLDENCKNIEGIKGIHAIEFYLCRNMEEKGLTEEQTAAVMADLAAKGVKGIRERNEALYQAEVAAGVRGRFHLTAIAKTNEGLKNLYRLSSLGWLKGYYKRPRIDLATLEKHKEGLIILSGCTSGALNEHLLAGDMAGAIEKAEWMRSLWGEDFYLEIMPHGLPDQIKVNPLLARMSKYMGIPLVATQDAHWVRKEDKEAQEALLCINTNDVMSNPERFKFDGDTFFLADRHEMAEMFRTHHSGLDAGVIEGALDATLEINEKATAALEIDRFKAMVPTIDMPPEFKGDEFMYLRHLCMDGWDTRNIKERSVKAAAKHGVAPDEMYKRYIKRLSFELEAIKRQRVQRYFLVIWDLYNWARANRVMVGPGRGSAGGSLVSFLLYITQIDPMEHALLFERFLAPGRIDLPDIDCDFEARRRDEVINFLRDRYGDDKTALIATVGTLKGKACLRDISRILQIPRHEVDEVTGSIIERSSGDERASQCLEDSFKEFAVCRDFDKKYPKVMQLAKKLEGQVRNLGMHAAGVVVSPEPLIDLVPLETRESNRANTGKRETMKVTAVDMYGAAGFGLMKIDILGLRNLDSIRDCLDAIKERHGEDIDLTWIDMEDPATLQGFTDHKYVGIFQYDTPSADKICEGVEFTAFEDVVAMIALDRPGTARSGLATEYIKRKRDPKARKPIHPIVDKICSDTLGVIVYQEHVMRIFTDVAGFSPATADSLRKKIAKKWGDEAIGKERENFINGAVSRGFDRKLAEDLITKITFFGSYGFNKSHATAYGTISYWQMWLKVHYPVEFMWSLLANEPQREEIMRLVKACRAMDIEVRSPEVNTAGPKWKLDGDSIVAAMSDLKGVGEGAMTAVERGRADGPYKHFIDFMQRTERRRVNRKVVEVMLKAGSFKGLVPNEKWLTEHLEEVWELGLKERWPEVAKLLVDSAGEPDYTEEERQLVAAEVNPTAFGKHPVEPYADFLNKLTPRWTSMGDERLYELEDAFLYGMILEVKYNQVGDFHTGTPPDEDEKRRMKWGARYANVNIEDLSGKQNRVKVDHDIFDDFRHIVDKGSGTIVALHVSINKKFHSMRAHYLVDVAEMHKKMSGTVAVAEGSGLAFDPLVHLNPYELSMTEHARVLAHSRKDIRAVAERVKSGSITVTGMVTHVNRKLDKKMNEMGFFGLQGAKGYLDCLCFASSWGRFKGMLKPGKIVRVTLKRDKSSNILDDRGPDPLQVLE